MAQRSSEGAGISATTLAPRLILASTSPARAALLRGAGIEPVIRASGVDEDAVLAGHAAQHDDPDVATAVAVLAAAKARAVATEPARTSEASAVVLGCDSLLEFDGEALGKPHTPQRAIERWKRIRGRSGVLHTGHHLCSADGQETGATSSTTVHFADICDAEIEAYVATGEPLQVAGAFTIDGYGGAFISGIDGDHHGVIGLSLPLLRELVGELGMAWVDLWNR